jgi:hypothetical protein
MSDKNSQTGLSKQLSKEETLEALCDTCRGLLIRPHDGIRADVEVTYIAENVLRAAKLGCPICTRLYKNFHKHDRPTIHAEGSTCTGTLRDRWLSRNKEEAFAVQEKEINFGLVPFSVDMGSYVHIDGQMLMQKERLHAMDRYNVLVTTSMAPHSGDKTRLATIKLWLHECVHSHDNCQRLASEKHTGSSPTRLIELRDLADPRLILSEGVTNEDRLCYATLSHRWHNAENMPRLLEVNYLTFQKGISLSSLPKVFCDAMEICRYLGIRYLWIDALCLIQDDPADCEREIASMGDIYANAYVNLGATGAAEKQERGLCYQSEQEGKLPFYLPIHRQGHIIDYLAYDRSSTYVPGSTALMSRGWVLQERMLSPRSIYFDDVISWECHTMLASERFPGGPPLPYRGSLPLWGLHLPKKLSRLLDLDDGQLQLYNKKGELHHRWAQVSTWFSNCTLTYDVDALPAISGLARAFSKTLDDSYLAGIWEGNIIPGLL